MKPWSPVTVQTEDSSSVTITVAKQSMSYLNKFIKLKCAPDLLTLGVFPNVKEISESMGAVHGIEKTLGPDSFSDPNILCVDIGSGVHPRTGALVAMRSKWSVVSVDPELRHEGPYPGVDRLTCYKGLFEEDKLAQYGRFSVVVLLGVHAHLQAPIDLGRVCEATGAYRVTAVLMPCCTELTVRGEDAHALSYYEDPCVISPHRLVRCFQHIELGNGGFYRGWDERHKVTPLGVNPWHVNFAEV